MLTKQIKCQHLVLQTLNHNPHAYFQYLQFLKCLKVELIRFPMFKPLRNP